MGKSDFGIPEIEDVCDVCGARFNRKFGTDLSGLFVCVFCSRYRHMVHALRFVNYMAEKDCQQEIPFTTEERPVPLKDIASHSRLDCGCDTCSARKVLKFIDKWHAAKGTYPMKRVY